MPVLTASSAVASNITKLVPVFESETTKIAKNVTELVADLLPVVLPVLGIAIAVVFGLKFIKKVMK